MPLCVFCSTVVAVGSHCPFCPVCAPQTLAAGVHRFLFGFALPVDTPPSVVIPSHRGHSPDGNGEGSNGNFYVGCVYAPGWASLAWLLDEGNRRRPLSVVATSRSCYVGRRYHLRAFTKAPLPTGVPPPADVDRHGKRSSPGSIKGAPPLPFLLGLTGGGAGLLGQPCPPHPVVE